MSILLGAEILPAPVVGIKDPSPSGAAYDLFELPMRLLSSVEPL